MSADQHGTDPDRTRPGVLFDVDGTLLDTNYLHVLAWWQAFEDTGHHGVSMASIHRSVGIASEGLVERLVGEEDEAAVRAHGEHYTELRDKVVALPGAPDLLRACANRGLAVVLATSGKKDDLDWMVPAIGAEDAVSGATTSSDVDEGKPAPNMLTVAMRTHGLDPARTVLVGDTVWDAKSAQAAGIRCVALTSGGISVSELREAGAAEVYDGPADLLQRLDGSLLAHLAPAAE